jgi:hypothetical protein
MTREIHINVTEDNSDQSKKDHRIVTYHVPCLVAKTNVTLVDETDQPLKMMCPYVEKSEYGQYIVMWCQLRDVPGQNYGNKERCGIYEGMKPSDYK